MHFLYKITNNLNNKIYIGQSINPEYRWYQHKSHSVKGNCHKQYLHKAMAKYGVENFVFEVIAVSLDQEEANKTEAILIEEYNSRDKKFGYNIKPGGNTAPQSEETKEKIRQATIQQIAEKGHPALGTKRTSEQLKKMSEIRLNNPVEYTEEVRRHMSEAHIGIKDSEKTKRKKSNSIKEQWKIRGEYDSKKCEAPDCTIEGKAKYKIINGIRYCNKHGLRMLRYGRLDTLQ
jgi:group I intron endonuclease